MAKDELLKNDEELLNDTNELIKDSNEELANTPETNPNKFKKTQTKIEKQQETITKQKAVLAKADLGEQKMHTMEKEAASSNWLVDALDAFGTTQEFANLLLGYATGQGQNLQDQLGTKSFGESLSQISQLGQYGENDEVTSLRGSDVWEAWLGKDEIENSFVTFLADMSTFALDPMNLAFKVGMPQFAMKNLLVKPAKGIGKEIKTTGEYIFNKGVMKKGKDLSGRAIKGIDGELSSIGKSLDNFNGKANKSLNELTKQKRLISNDLKNGILESQGRKRWSKDSKLNEEFASKLSKDERLKKIDESITKFTRDSNDNFTQYIRGQDGKIITRKYMEDIQTGLGKQRKYATELEKGNKDSARQIALQNSDYFKDTIKDFRYSYGEFRKRNKEQYKIFADSKKGLKESVYSVKKNISTLGQGHNAALKEIGDNLKKTQVELKDGVGKLVKNFDSANGKQIFEDHKPILMRDMSYEEYMDLSNNDRWSQVFEGVKDATVTYMEGASAMEVNWFFDNILFDRKNTRTNKGVTRPEYEMIIHDDNLKEYEGFLSEDVIGALGLSDEWAHGDDFVRLNKIGGDIPGKKTNKYSIDFKDKAYRELYDAYRKNNGKKMLEKKYGGVFFTGSKYRVPWSKELKSMKEMDVINRDILNSHILDEKTKLKEMVDNGVSTSSANYIKQDNLVNKIVKELEDHDSKIDTSLRESILSRQHYDMDRMLNEAIQGKGKYKGSENVREILTHIKKMGTDYIDSQNRMNSQISKFGFNRSAQFEDLWQGTYVPHTFKNVEDIPNRAPVFNSEGGANQSWLSMTERKRKYEGTIKDVNDLNEGYNMFHNEIPVILSQATDTFFRDLQRTAPLSALTDSDTILSNSVAKTMDEKFLNKNYQRISRKELESVMSKAGWLSGTVDANYTQVNEIKKIFRKKITDQINFNIDNHNMKYGTNLSKSGNSEVWIPRKVVELLDSNHLTSDASAIGRIIDSFTNHWKSLSLMSLGFQARTYVGDTLQMRLGGMGMSDILRNRTKGVKWYKQATDLGDDLTTMASAMDIPFQKAIDVGRDIHKGKIPQELLDSKGANLLNDWNGILSKKHDYEAFDLVQHLIDADKKGTISSNWLMDIYGDTLKAGNDKIIKKLESGKFGKFDARDKPLKQMINTVTSKNFDLARKGTESAKFGLYVDMKQNPNKYKELKRKMGIDNTEQINNIKQNFKGDKLEKDKRLKRLRDREDEDYIRNLLYDPFSMSKNEKTIMKRVMPYYSFWREAVISLSKQVMSGSILKPMFNINKMITEGWESALEEDMDANKEDVQTLLPMMAKDGIKPVRGTVNPKDSEQNNMKSMSLGSPLDVIYELSTNPLSSVVSQSSPLIQSIYELGMGKDFYSGQDVDKKETLLNFTPITKKVKKIVDGSKSFDDVDEEYPMSNITPSLAFGFNPEEQLSYYYQSLTQKLNTMIDKYIAEGYTIQEISQMFQNPDYNGKSIANIYKKNWGF